MGALHAGHLALVREARGRCGAVVVTVFVNPTQFGPGEDFERYPRDLESDLDRLAEEGGVDVVFFPSDAEIYPGGAGALRVSVHVTGMADVLCGPFRPGHFEGVATIVCKLFNVCRPDVAVFGRKDAQQFVIIRRMNDDLNLGIDVVGVDTVREPDGLALSSRNAYLTSAERSEAVVLSRAAAAARRFIEGGERAVDVILRQMEQEVANAPLARLQYASVVDGESLEETDELVSGQTALAALAVHFGSTRLIDNAFVRVP